MKLLVIGSGMMGSAAAFDMARQSQVSSVTLADNDLKRAKEVAARVNRITRDKKVRPVELEAANEPTAAKLMRGHDAALSAVPYFLNLGLAKAALEARCHFADLGGNNTVVRQELALAEKAEKRGVAIAPVAASRPAWRPFSAENSCAASVAAPTRSNSTSADCRKNPCRHFTTSWCSPLKV